MCGQALLWPCLFVTINVSCGWLSTLARFEKFFWHNLIGFLMPLVSFLLSVFLSFCKSKLLFLCHGCLHSNLWSCPRIKSVVVLFVHYWNLNMLHYFSTFSSSPDIVISVWSSLLMIVSLLIFCFDGSNLLFPTGGSEVWDSLEEALTGNFASVSQVLGSEIYLYSSLVTSA